MLQVSSLALPYLTVLDCVVCWLVVFTSSVECLNSVVTVQGLPFPCPRLFCIALISCCLCLLPPYVFQFLFCDSLLFVIFCAWCSRLFRGLCKVDIYGNCCALRCGLCCFLSIPLSSVHEGRACSQSGLGLFLCFLFVFGFFAFSMARNLYWDLEGLGLESFCLFASLVCLPLDRCYQLEWSLNVVRSFCAYSCRLCIILKTIAYR